MTLGLPWGSDVDQWSMGCILSELWTGSLLFPTHDEIEHLALMERSLGALPRHMLRAAKSKRAERNFRHGHLRWPERAMDRESEEHVRAQPRLREAIMSDPRGEPVRGVDIGCAASFHDLLRDLLEYDPEMRCTASRARTHPFVGHACSFFAASSRGASISKSKSGASSASALRSTPQAQADGPPREAGNIEDLALPPAKMRQRTGRD